MDVLLAIVTGALYAVGVYLMLRRNVVKLILGLAIISNAANLLIFTAGGITRGVAPVIAADAEKAVPPFADPLPQALILTAIVISFGFLAFSMVLFHRTCQIMGTDDVDEMRTTDL